MIKKLEKITQYCVKAPCRDYSSKRDTSYDDYNTTLASALGQVVLDIQAIWGLFHAPTISNLLKKFLISAFQKIIVKNK